MSEFKSLVDALAVNDNIKKNLGQLLGETEAVGIAAVLNSDCMSLMPTTPAKWPESEVVGAPYSCGVMEFVGLGNPSEWPDLRQRVERASRLVGWNNLPIGRRWQIAKQDDAQYDPAGAQAEQAGWDSARREACLERQIRDLELSQATVPSEVVLKTSGLARLRQELAYEKRRFTLSDTTSLITNPSDLAVEPEVKSTAPDLAPADAQARAARASLHSGATRALTTASQEEPENPMAWLVEDMARRRRTGEAYDRDTMVLALHEEFPTLKKRDRRTLFTKAPKELKRGGGRPKGSRNSGPK